MKGTFRLIDGINTRQKISIAERSRGYLRYGFIVLDPNTDYDLDSYELNGKDIKSDDTFVRSLKETVFKKSYSESLENELKAHNVSYRIEMCKSCGGRKRTIVYHPIEVLL